MADTIRNNPEKLARVMAIAERLGIPFHAPGTSPQAQGFTPMEGPTHMNVPGEWEKTPNEAGYMPMEGAAPVWNRAPDDAQDFAPDAGRDKLAALLAARNLGPQVNAPQEAMQEPWQKAPDDAMDFAPNSARDRLARLLAMMNANPQMLSRAERSYARSLGQ